jgi:hypothetical protein
LDIPAFLRRRWNKTPLSMRGFFIQ